MKKHEKTILIIAVAAVFLLLVSGYLSVVLLGWDINFHNTATKATFTVTETPSFYLGNDAYSKTFSSPNPNGYYLAANITKITVDGNEVALPGTTLVCKSYTMTNDVQKDIAADYVKVSYTLPKQAAGQHTVVVTAHLAWMTPSTADSCLTYMSQRTVQVPSGNKVPTYGKILTFTDTFTVTSGTTPPSTPPTAPIVEFWNALTSFIAGVLSWLRGLLPFTIATASTPVNVPYSAALSLSGIPATDTDYSDGFVSETQCSGFIIDSAGAYKYQGTPAVLATGVTTYSTTVSFTPTVAGKYAQGIACIGRNATYNYGTSAWSSWTSPIVVASDKGDITVTGPGAPPAAPVVDFWNSITSFITGILCSVFGWFC